MGLFNNGIIDKVDMKLVEPIANLKAGYSYMIYLYNDHILIKDILSKKDAHLSISQVKEVFYGTETEIIEKNKSVVGRAVIGSIISPVGAVVGAISGVGTKKKKVSHTYFIIKFISSEGMEDYVKFEDTNLSGRKFAKKLNELIGHVSEKHAVL